MVVMRVNVQGVKNVVLDKLRQLFLYCESMFVHTKLISYYVRIVWWRPELILLNAKNIEKVVDFLLTKEAPARNAPGWST